MSVPHDRRSFISIVASLAGLAAARVSAAQQPRQRAGCGVRPLRHGVARSDEGAAQAALRSWQATSWPSTRVRSASRATFSTRSATCIHLEYPDINTAVGISGPAFPMNASDRLWAKYKLGERSKIIDPMTKQPAVRNIFLRRRRHQREGDPGARRGVLAVQRGARRASRSSWRRRFRCRLRKFGPIWLRDSIPACA